MNFRIEAKKYKRIICLTEETTETLYEIGAEELIVGISKYTVRPDRARKEKTKVSHFTEANIEQIISLKPDLVIAWSDLQADICKDLIKEGIEVVCFNHRSIAGILGMIDKLGALIGYASEAEVFKRKLQNKLKIAAEKGEARKLRPIVYFEEWFDPLITGIEWVSELVELSGGIEAFPEYAKQSLAKNRILKSFNEVIPKNPDILIASWCGKPFRKSRVIERAGWNELNFMINNQIHEIPSPIILQPGPAALTEGLDNLMKILDDWEAKN